MSNDFHIEKMILVAILCGLVAMFAFGTGNFTKKFALDDVGATNALYVLHIINFLVFTPVILFSIYKGYFSISLIQVLATIAYTSLCILGIYNFTKALEIGEVAIITPIGGASIVLTVVLSILFLGEVFVFLDIVAIFMAFIGIFLTSVNFSKIKNMRNTKGIKEALYAFVFFGLFLFFNGSFSSQLDFFSFFLVPKYLISILILGFLSLFKRQEFDYKKLKPKPVIIMFCCFLLLNLGWFSYQFGSKFGSVVISSLLMGQNAVVSIVLSIIILKEKLLVNQVFGIILIFISLIILGV